MEIVIERLAGVPAADAPFEVVERKGPGHPDSLCDGVAEEACRALCRLYAGRLGAVLHHNVDKCALVAGSAAPAYGGGAVLEKIRLLVIGRAADRWDGEAFPIEEVVREASRAWLRRTVRHLDPDRHVTIESLLHGGAPELQRLLAPGAAPLCNDTSVGVGRFPPTPCETATLAAVAALVSPAFQARVPAAGEDIKVMTVRRGRRVALTVSCAMVGRWLRDASAYRDAREAVRIQAEAAARGAVPGLDVGAVANAADDDATGAVFLTVTGTSAERGDDGLTGRGNRVGGLITPLREMSLEAAAGKNPVSHVGKIYNVAAREMARMLADSPGVVEAVVLLVSRIGRPLDEPAAALVRARSALDDRELRARSEACVAAVLATLPALGRQIQDGHHVLF